MNTFHSSVVFYFFTEPCFPGTYMPRSGLNEVCAPCPVHYYQREAGAINCVPCYNRSLASSNVTGADDTYVCALSEWDGPPFFYFAGLSLFSHQCTAKVP